MTKNFKYIPYRQTLVSRQKPIDSFILDFYCARLRLGVEVDGDIHKKLFVRDKERDNVIKEKFNITVLRYTNKEILETPKEVIINLERIIQRISNLPLDKGD